MNSSASSRVRFATERTSRSSQSSSYRKDGMSLMWMPAQTTLPPLATEASAAGTSSPAGAKMMAASSGSGGGSLEQPPPPAPGERGDASARAAPGRGEAEEPP